MSVEAGRSRAGNDPIENSRGELRRFLIPNPYSRTLAIAAEVGIGLFRPRVCMA
jgi:hypothetical protein